MMSDAQNNMDTNDITTDTIANTVENWITIGYGSKAREIFKDQLRRFNESWQKRWQAELHQSRGYEDPTGRNGAQATNTPTTSKCGSLLTRRHFRQTP
jgi:hypothetical protein